jgi:hypothetical protein
MLKATVKFGVDRAEIVPTEGRAEWLDRFGIPKPHYTIEVDVPIGLWERAGGHVNTDGTITSMATAPHGALKRAAVDVARASGEPGLTEEQAELALVACVAARELDARERATQEEVKRQKSELFLAEWLGADDNTIADADGVRTWLRREGDDWSWDFDGDDVLPRMDERFLEAMARRRAIYNGAYQARLEQEKAKEDACVEALVAWASERNPLVVKGIDAGYTMHNAVLDTIQEALSERAKLPVECLIDGTASFNAIDMVRRDSPNERALEVLAQMTEAVGWLKQKLPPCVGFDEVEVCRAHDCDLEEKFTCVAVMVSTPIAADRILYVQTG